MRTLTLKDRSFGGKAAPDWATAVAQFRDSWYWEESLEQADGKRFQLVGKGVTGVYDESAVRGYTTSYHLPPSQPQDDPLPPVPESVEYREAVLPQLFLRAHIRSDGLGVQMQIADPGVIVLDPDSALQLAHDIRRMAMQIKRNQKQEQAQ